LNLAWLLGVMESQYGDSGCAGMTAWVDEGVDFCGQPVWVSGSLTVQVKATHAVRENDANGAKL
jgi:hypothetical protein